MACKGQGVVEVCHACVVLHAHDEAQASRKALARALGLWPLGEGWCDHSVAVVEVTVGATV
jgi:hypothetical protein